MAPDLIEMIFNRLDAIDARLEKLDDKLDKEIDPIKDHISKSKLLGVLFMIFFPPIVAILVKFL